MDFKIRESRKPQGAKRLAAERTAYFLLVQQGFSNNQACRIVGIDPRSGRRWRNGYVPSNRMGPARPIPPAVPQASSRFLCVDERIYIADRLREKATVRSIAADLGRSPSTVSREIGRNQHPESGVYRPHAAQARADARRPRPKVAKIAQHWALRQAIQQRLDQRWSPEQICQALPDVFPQRPELHVVPETIYQALYVQARGELRREVHRALRTGRVRRKPRRQSQKRSSRFTDPMILISERPAEAEDRAVPGHWESQ
jgi:transposase, IS30 family